MSRMSRRPANKSLPKVPTGIQGLDEITRGGLPKGRSSLVCGGPGCGKTLLGMEFLARGAIEYNEPGVCMSFEETEDELAANVASLGFDLPQLIRRKKLSIDYVRVDRSEIEETGQFNLDGLFVRMKHAIRRVKAKRVVLDSIEALFSGFANATLLRAELRRLFHWLKQQNVTAMVTAERGDGSLTRHGLEEYIADFVMLLDYRVTDQISTRRLRIIKYRGTAHGGDEHPFLIDERGISVFPITSLMLDHSVSTERVSTGVPDLDEMLGGKGFFRGSSILVSGTAGSGKSSLASAFAAAACKRGEHCLYFAFEESASQLARNMRSIGIDLEAFAKQDLLRIHATRGTRIGLDARLTTMQRMAQEFRPRVVIVDPISNLVSSGALHSAQAMLAKLIDFLKAQKITAVFTALATSSHSAEGSSLETEVGMSSLMDAWIQTRDMEMDGRRRIALCILKVRGMPHSRQLHELQLSERGIELLSMERERAPLRTMGTAAGID